MNIPKINSIEYFASLLLDGTTLQHKFDKTYAIIDLDNGRRVNVVGEDWDFMYHSLYTLFITDKDFKNYNIIKDE